MPPPYVPVRQDAKKMRYIEWLTTPPQERVPATERELARELDVIPKTLYNWKKHYGGMEVGDIRRVRQLEEETKKLKQLVVDLSLDKVMLHDLLSRKW